MCGRKVVEGYHSLPVAFQPFSRFRMTRAYAFANSRFDRSHSVRVGADAISWSFLFKSGWCFSETTSSAFRVL